MSKKRWTEERIAAAMQRWAKLYGRQPTLNDWPMGDKRYPGRITIIDAFGNWNNALVYAGFEARLPGDWIGAALDEENEWALTQWEYGRSLADIGHELGITGQALGRRLALYREKRREDYLRKVGGED